VRDLWIETWRSIVAHRVRFGLTSLGIAWGAFMLTVLSSNLAGFEQHFVAEFEELGPKVVMMGPGVILENRVGQRGARHLELEAEDIDRLAALASVEHVAPEVGFRSLPVRNGRVSKLMRVMGVDWDSSLIRNLQVERGRFVSRLDVDRAARVAVLGAVAAERLFAHLDPIGRSLMVDGFRFRVVGILAPKGQQLMNSGDRDDLKLLLPYTTAQRWLSKTDDIRDFVFAPITKPMASAAIDHVKQLTALHAGYDPANETALWYFNVQEPLRFLRTLFIGIRVFVVAAGLVTLFVGAVGVMNMMLVVVGERTREIGVRKAVGATGRQVFVQLLAEATLVAGVSGVLGAAAGMGLVQAMRFVIPEGAPYQSPPVFEPVTTAVLTLSLVGVGVVSGLVPAARAARTPPSEALRAS
jgi:putative ABC transport system permease protein